MSWLMVAPTTTVIWLVLLGVGLVYAGKVLYPTRGSFTMYKHRTRIVVHALSFIYGGVIFMLLSVLAYFYGAA